MSDMFQPIDPLLLPQVTGAESAPSFIYQDGREWLERRLMADCEKEGGNFGTCLRASHEVRTTVDALMKEAETFRYGLMRPAK